MGVHTNAEKIVKEFGFSPTQSHSTTKTLGPAARSDQADAVVAAMDGLLSQEGIVRIYALLASAMETTKPKFDIGTGGKLLKNAMQKKLDPAKKKNEMQAELQELKVRMSDLEAKLKSE